MMIKIFPWSLGEKMVFFFLEFFGSSMQIEGGQDTVLIRLK